MNQLYKEYYQKLLRFIISRVHNKEDAQDILSEVFIKIHTNINTLESKEKLTSWVYTITRNAIIDFYRTKKQSLPLENIGEEFLFAKEEEENIYDELSLCLTPIIETLPKQYAQVLKHSELLGMKQAQIAKENNLSLSNIKSIIFRGRKKIKEKLFECCNYEYDSQGSVISYTKKEKNCKFC